MSLYRGFVTPMTDFHITIIVDEITFVKLSGTYVAYSKYLFKRDRYYKSIRLDVVVCGHFSCSRKGTFGHQTS